MQEENINLSLLKYISGANELEALVFKTNPTRELSLVVYIHGHNQLGAWDTVFNNYLLSKAGYSVFAPSQAGYGFSQGQRDYCGPGTVEGVIIGVEQFLKTYPEYQNKVAIWGRSRGAIVAAQVLAQRPSLFRAGVLESGVYDLEKDYHDLNKLEGIKQNMFDETGGTDKELRKRSVIDQVGKYTCPVLILHGDQDENINVEQSRLLSEKMTALHKPHELVILEGADHFITKQVRRKYIIPFLEKHNQSL